MTKEEKNIAVFLRLQKKKNKEIAAVMNLPYNSIKSFFSRQSEESIKPHCFQCEKVIPFDKKTKVPKFCSPACKNRWWNAHPEKRKNSKEHICKNCGKKFYSQRSNSMFCSRPCYLASVKGGDGPC